MAQQVVAPKGPLIPPKANTLAPGSPSNPFPTATAAMIDKIEEVKEKTTRPRPSVNYGKDYVFDSEAVAQKSIPLYESGKPAENLAIHKITRVADEKDFFVWANTPQSALAFVVLAQNSYSWPEGKRGRTAKLDENILKFARYLRKAGDTAELESLFASAGEQYRAALDATPA